MAVIVTIASVVFVGMTALLVGFIIIAQKNRKEGEDSSLESMSNQYIFQYNQSLYLNYYYEPREYLTSLQQNMMK